VGTSRAGERGKKSIKVANEWLASWRLLVRIASMGDSSQSMKGNVNLLNALVGFVGLTTISNCALALLKTLARPLRNVCCTKPLGLLLATLTTTLSLSLSLAAGQMDFGTKLIRGRRTKTLGMLLRMEPIGWPWVLEEQSWFRRMRRTGLR